MPEGVVGGGGGKSAPPWKTLRLREAQADSPRRRWRPKRPQIRLWRGPKIQERIENTARICADQIWKPLQEQWHRRFPLIINSPQRKQRTRARLAPRERPGVRDQHYSPVFSNRFWASGNAQVVRVYSRGVDSRITSRDVGFKTWGREAFIYSQSLERLFGLIEGDAKASPGSR